MPVCKDRVEGPDRDPGTRPSRWQTVVGVVGLVVVLWVGIEMYDVVFFDGYGSAGDTPAVDLGPTDGGVHGPPAGGHG